MNPLLELTRHGQSYWLDNLERRALENGALARRVEREGLRGVTSNPKTFHDAILGSSDYREQIEAGAAAGLSAPQIYEELVTSDVQRACDVLRPAHDDSEGRDGFVSLEVSPRLANDTAGTVAEARRLWQRVNRPNLMIKIPGTRAGVPAVEEALYEGINVNITLLFSIARYGEVRDAFVRAMQRRLSEGRPVRNLHSVASFFLSRIDVACDELLEQRSADGVARLRGKVAVASAKLAYRDYRAAMAQQRCEALTRAGVAPQRLLWASTGTKNPSYPDLMYVEPLIGPQTVSTMPEKTIAAFADHGKVSDSLERDVDRAEQTLKELASLGIALDAVTEQLVADGVQKFIEPYDELIAAFDQAVRRARPTSAGEGHARP